MIETTMSTGQELTFVRMQCGKCKREVISLNDVGPYPEENKKYRQQCTCGAEFYAENCKAFTVEGDEFAHFT